MRGIWQTAQNFIQVPPPVDVELHAPNNTFKYNLEFYLRLT